MPSASTARSELDRRQHVAQRVVGAMEHDSAAFADRLQPVVLGERLEEPERLEGAGDAVRNVFDPCSSERMLEQREVEARVVRDEDRVAEQRAKLACDVGE